MLAGTFISLFALFFFLYEGDRIWSWVVRLFPTAARERVASSGEVAWGQLTAFTRATLLVALVDAAGITLVALILRVPFALAIGALVFLGAFIPIVGALMSGLVAVLIALVAHGPIVALLMLAGVIAVQQLESHVLQPFLLGRAVSVHPLAVVLAITAGVVVAGIVGALVAVPVAAVLNGVFKHLHGASVAEAAVGPVVSCRRWTPPYAKPPQNSTPNRTAQRSPSGSSSTVRTVQTVRTTRPEAGGTTAQPPTTHRAGTSSSSTSMTSKAVGPVDVAPVSATDAPSG